MYSPLQHLGIDLGIHRPPPPLPFKYSPSSTSSQCVRPCHFYLPCSVLSIYLRRKSSLPFSSPQIDLPPAPIDLQYLLLSFSVSLGTQTIRLPQTQSSNSSGIPLDKRLPVFSDAEGLVTLDFLMSLIYMGKSSAVFYGQCTASFLLPGFILISFICNYLIKTSYSRPFMPFSSPLVSNYNQSPYAKTI